MAASPISTYRLQLGPHLDFDGACELVGYLADLGVSHLYMSPVLTARSSSTHGYDVADPATVADVLGGEAGLRRLAAAAAERGLGLVADIVPNHLGTGPDNPLWEALLAEGQNGPAGSVFDVDWHHPLPGAEGKVILPVLGEQYGDVLDAGELRVVEEDGAARLRYHEHSFPLSPESLEALERSATLESLHGHPGQPETWARLHGLLESQHYRLVHWRAGHALINYRRFFAIDELAGVRVEDPEVFERTHAKILELVADGVLDGLRVDHPDGLRDPAGYLTRLAERTGGVWTVVEKILADRERLRDWPVAGTTGYELANDVLGLFVDPDTAATLERLDDAFDAPAADYHQREIEAKREVLDHDLHADLRRLGRRLWRLTQRHPTVRDVDDLACTEAVARTLQALAVYRTYVDPATGAASEEDRQLIGLAVQRARELEEQAWSLGRDLAPDPLYRFLAEVLSGDAGDSVEHLDFLARFQQLSGAVMAKGVEDTAFYRYQRLVALNEVGADPARWGLSSEALHERNATRARHHPAGLLTTSTHDTKRGEDVRLRIAALSELADPWSEQARRWREAHRGRVGRTSRGPAPDAQTELLAYQTMVGMWPTRDADRLKAYLVKASREAGLRTSWTDPDEEFEQATGQFVDELSADGSFLRSLDDIGRQANEIAMVTGLAQTLLRCTTPGVPDTYQGTELWEDSLVDPDNRRPVDFAERRKLLAELDADCAPGELWRARADGRVKLWVLSRALRTRREHPDAAFGDYTPLEVTGRWAGHLFAFARTGERSAFCVVVPRLPAKVMAGQEDGPLAGAWADTAVDLPPALAQRSWTDALTGAAHDPTGSIAAADTFATLPVGLLVAGGG